MTQPWFPAEAAGVAIGLIGGAVVLLCAVFGAFSRWLARQGQAKGLVLGGFASLGVVGLGAVLFALYAAICQQPSYIWCPILVLATAILGALALGLPGIITRYRRAHQRRELQTLADQLIGRTSSRLLARIDPSHRWR